MSELKSKIAFGSEKDIDKALEDGLINSYDLLLLDEHKIGWVDGDNKKVIIRAPQPDHNENNPNSENYIKNRLAYTEYKTTVLLEEMVVSTSHDEPGNLMCDPALFSIEYGKTYIVTVDGVDYECIASVYTEGDYDIFIIGNLRFAELGDDSKEPFIFAFVSMDGHTYNMFAFFDAETFEPAEGDHIISVCVKDAVIHKINPDYYERLAYTEGGFTDERMLISATNFSEPEVIGFGRVARLWGSDELANDGSSFFEENTWYKVTLNEEVYYCKPKALGDTYLIGQADILTGVTFREYPFFAIEMVEKVADAMSNRLYIGIKDSYLSSANLSIYKTSGCPEVVHKINPKYYDRIAWEEESAEEIFNDIVTISGEPCIIEPQVFSLKPGCTYDVTIFGDTYRTIAIRVGAGTEAANFIGNQAYLGLSDNGVPFAILSNCADNGLDLDYNVVMAVTPGTDDAVFGDVHIKIVEINNLVHTVDHKYLDFIEETKRAIVENAVLTYRYGENEYSSTFSLKEFEDREYPVLVKIDNNIYHSTLYNYMFEETQVKCIGRKNFFSDNSFTKEEPFMIAIDSESGEVLAVIDHELSGITPDNHRLSIYYNDGPQIKREFLKQVDNPFVKINLSNYGFDVYELMSMGGGVADITHLEDIDKLRQIVSSDKQVILVVDDRNMHGNMHMEVQMIKYYNGDEVTMLCASGIIGAESLIRADISIDLYYGRIMMAVQPALIPTYTDVSKEGA